MADSKLTRRKALASIAGLGTATAAGLVSGCSDDAVPVVPMELDLDDPIDLAFARQKVRGSVVEERLDSFIRFHFYGQVPGEKAKRLLSMNNYVIHLWTPIKRGTYHLKHYEVGYYTEFDTDKPLETWLNPYTNEEVEAYHFILGPIEREYSPEGVIAPGLAPVPLQSHVMGDRFILATEAISLIPNMFQPDEWPKRSSGKNINWLSLMTQSASMADVLNPELNSAPPQIQLQNFIAWGSWMQMGGISGGSMARAYGTDIAGFDALSPDVRAAFEKYTPEIFDIESWTDVRFDEWDYFNLMQERRKAGKI
jgi:hypothetical protein